jgi:hypothetical protein
MITVQENVIPADAQAIKHPNRTANSCFAMISVLDFLVIWGASRKTFLRTQTEKY